MSAERTAPRAQRRRRDLNASRTRVNARKMTLIKFTSLRSRGRTRHRRRRNRPCGLPAKHIHTYNNNVHVRNIVRDHPFARAVYISRNVGRQSLAVMSTAVTATATAAATG